MSCASCDHVCDVRNIGNADYCKNYSRNRENPESAKHLGTEKHNYATKEVFNAEGFVYVKCRFCGSILVRRPDSGVPDVGGDDLPIDDYSGGSDAAYTIGAAEPETPYIDKAPPFLSEEERRHNARAYGMRVKERGCVGICVRYDSRTCSGGQCKNCEVFLAGLCCKRYLINSDKSNMLERDGGDYRNLMGDFIRRLYIEKEYDDDIRRRLLAEAAKADAYRDEMRKFVCGAEDSNLIYEWREYTLDDMMVMFPHIERRPVRIEIQLLIYIFYNFRYPIDLEHAETRFQIPKLAINRYLRAFFGYSYTSLLAKMRNEFSKTLLGIPLLRIGEIGILAGYKSHFHYSLNFKRYEGVSPKEFRQFALERAPLV
jgi:AraC-like DNA-binding protein